MTEANKTLVRRLVEEVFNGGRLEVIDELYAPELAAAARRWITPFRASFPDVHMELVELIAEGDKVVVRATWSGTHQGDLLGIPATGRAVTVAVIEMARLANGQMVEHWSSWDQLGMLQQLGVIPAPGQTTG